MLSSVEVASVLAVEHWAAVKSIHAFKSKSLQEVNNSVPVSSLILHCVVLGVSVCGSRTIALCTGGLLGGIRQAFCAK